MKPSDSPDSPASSSGRKPKSAIGFDYGERRIGLAVLEPVTGRASPLKTVRCTSRGPDWSAIDDCVTEWQPDVLVVGIPLGAEGEEQTMTAHARRFARRLEKRFGLPVETVDETLSSAEAKDMLREQRRRGVRRKRIRKEDIDQRAAQIILERWYDLRGPEAG